MLPFKAINSRRKHYRDIISIDLGNELNIYGPSDVKPKFSE